MKTISLNIPYDLEAKIQSAMKAGHGMDSYGKPNRSHLLRLALEAGLDALGARATTVVNPMWVASDG